MTQAEKTVKQICYKYRSMANPDECARTERVIVNSQVYFASPSQFNDPFEFAFSADFTGDDRVKRAYFRAHLRERYPEWTDAQRQEALGLYLDETRKVPSSEFERRFREGVKSKLNSSAAILSLSAKPDDVLMWAHYADAHRGVCLGFSPNCFQGARPVLYTDALPIVPVFSMTRAHIREVCTTKSSHWAYEEEWRVVKARQGHTEYAPDGLVEVILGARVTAEARDQIRYWLRQRSHTVTVRQAVLSETNYALDLRTT